MSANFLKLGLLDRTLLNLLQHVVRDNVVSNDVAIMSALLINVKIFGMNFLLFVKLVITVVGKNLVSKIAKLCLNLLKLCREDYNFFLDTLSTCIQCAAKSRLSPKVFLPFFSNRLEF